MCLIPALLLIEYGNRLRLELFVGALGFVATLLAFVALVYPFDAVVYRFVAALLAYLFDVPFVCHGFHLHAVNVDHENRRRIVYVDYGFRWRAVYLDYGSLGGAH